ncbi:Rpn family recombination-promoting nuclease/putative transposase [Kalamiella sp. sgz302252]|uniref:Rpn family recombination-promoting nuclease/putative transposase n=1 Tax=Pantoea sp. sgz302252 TaxID=3341827 RepID=UPI0036D43263
MNARKARRGKHRVTTPHDAAFKQCLSHPQTARDFMELHLPARLQKLCDFTTLSLESGSFIEDDLRAYFSDVLYSVKTSQGDGFIYVLIEHQSSPDRHMGFRLLRYAIGAMQRHLDAGYEKLPLVIPVLFYAGKRSPYPYPVRWLDEFDNPELAAELYNRQFPLVDVTVIPDEEIMNHRSMAALTLLQKHIYQRDMASLMNKLVAILQKEEMTGQQLSSLINYLVLAGETAEPAAFVHELARRVPQHKEKLMTIAQYFEQKGLKTGIEQGIEQGKEKGRLEGKREMAENLLSLGVPLDSVLKASGLREEELAQPHH